jgi:glycosyltransferase A (GT-A) superfamily protein (DUF2064 family)
MNDSSAAIVVFVKTPGLSPLKTRLAAELGRKKADEFYHLSAAAVEATVAAAAVAHRVSPYWAVAELEGMGDPRWRRFPRIHQGGGGLGERLQNVFCELRKRFRIVAAIGADSPQIRSKAICAALQYLQSNRANGTSVLGRCPDGGFYLVGTNIELPSDVWVDVPYSASDTADRMALGLKRHGEVLELPALTDVDDVRDLQALQSELQEIRDPTAEQTAVLAWLNQQITPLDENGIR